jgi:hypothetical protein
LYTSCTCLGFLFFNDISPTYQKNKKNQDAYVTLFIHQFSDFKMPFLKASHHNLLLFPYKPSDLKPTKYFKEVIEVFEKGIVCWVT